MTSTPVCRACSHMMANNSHSQAHVAVENTDCTTAAVTFSKSVLRIDKFKTGRGLQKSCRQCAQTKRSFEDPIGFMKFE